jgi:hypothetical protein
MTTTDNGYGWLVGGAVAVGCLSVLGTAFQKLEPKTQSPRQIIAGAVRGDTDIICYDLPIQSSSAPVYLEPKAQPSGQPLTLFEGFSSGSGESLGDVTFGQAMSWLSNRGKTGPRCQGNDRVPENLRSFDPSPPLWRTFVANPNQFSKPAII